MTCCYGGVDNIYTGVPTTLVIHVLNGSDLSYNWTVGGPSHAVVEARGSDVVVVFNENSSYVVSVTVWNSVSSASVDVEVTSRGVACFPPRVRLVGSARRSELRSREVRLETVVSADCLHYRLKHEWSVWIGNCVDLDADGSASLSALIGTDTPTLRLPVRTLDYGAHCVQFRSCYYEAPGCSSVSVDVQILRSSLRAIIGGGDERWVVVSEKIIFDGSLSYDPDVDNDALSFLAYNWTCQVAHSTVLLSIRCLATAQF